MSAPVTSGISELVLVVQDAQKSCAFYRDVAGLHVEREASEGWAWLWTGALGASPRLGLRAGSLLFEEHSSKPSAERWGSVHFAIRINRDELDARLTRVRDAGIEILGPTHFEWMQAEGWYFYDPDQNLVEFWVPDES